MGVSPPREGSITPGSDNPLCNDCRVEPVPAGASFRTYVPYTPVARPLRPNIAGASYHVMARGNERSAIFLDDRDRAQFLETLAGTGKRYGWECLAYCLMANHYHLIIRTPQPNLSLGMRLLNGGYANWFNVRHDRVGHVFQGRFRSVLLRSSLHLRTAVRYVLRNPVVAELCTHPRDWRWSSYEATLGRQRNGLVAATATLAWFGEDDDVHGRFARFIAGEDTDPRETALLDDIELPFHQSEGPRPALEQVLTEHPGAHGIALAHGYHGYSLNDVASALGLSSSTVGRMLVVHEAEEMRTASARPRVR